MFWIVCAQLCRLPEASGNQSEFGVIIIDFRLQSAQHLALHVARSVRVWIIPQTVEEILESKEIPNECFEFFQPENLIVLNVESLKGMLVLRGNQYRRDAIVCACTLFALSSSHGYSPHIQPLLACSCSENILFPTRRQPQCPSNIHQYLFWCFQGECLLSSSLWPLWHPNSLNDEKQTNSEALQEQVRLLKQEISRIELGGGERARSLHKKRGKLLARERIQGLLDSG